MKILFIIWPWLLSSLLLAVFFQKNLFDFSPYWGDELVYWLSSKAFHGAGWEAGYFGISEIQAPLSFSHWGLHGPLFPMLMQFLNIFSEWKPYSGVIINHVLLSFGFAFYWMTLKVDQKTKVIILLVLMTFWALTQFATCNMQESWHHFIAIALAGLVLKNVNDPNHSFDAADALIFLLMIYSAFMRPSWAILVFPVSLIYVKTWRSALAAMALSLVMLGLSPLVFQKLAAPMPNGGAQFVKFMNGSESFEGSLNYFFRNFDLFFKGDATEQNQRLQIFLLVLFCIGLVCLELTKVGIKSVLSSRNKALIGIAMTLSAYVLATLTMYLVGGQADYRVLSSPLLFAILILFGLNLPHKTLLGGALITLNLWALPTYLQNFEKFREPNFNFSSVEVDRFRSATIPFFDFSKNSSPWCNTIVSGGLDPWVYPEFQGLPEGFGVQGVWNWQFIQLPLKSKFLLLDQDIFSTEKLQYLPRMRFLNSNKGTGLIEIERIGTLHVKELKRLELLGRKVILFENLDTICKKN